MFLKKSKFEVWISKKSQKRSKFSNFIIIVSSLLFKILSFLIDLSIIFRLLTLTLNSISPSKGRESCIPTNSISIIIVFFGVFLCFRRSVRCAKCLLVYFICFFDYLVCLQVSVLRRLSGITWIDPVSILSQFPVELLDLWVIWVCIAVFYGKIFGIDVRYDVITGYFVFQLLSCLFDIDIFIWACLKIDELILFEELRQLRGTKLTTRHCIHHGLLAYLVKLFGWVCDRWQHLLL